LPHDEAVLRKMLEQIEVWEASQDRRAIFLSCYSVMTRNMIHSLKSGVFHDEKWVDELLNHFADYYFRAHEVYESGSETAPPIWRLTFEAAQNPKVLAVQHLILGVNAHINFDLVLALVDMLEPEWMSLADIGRRRRFQDHCTINTIIASSIDEVQDSILERYSPGMSLIDRAFGHLDEMLISKLITHWRERVWQNAARCVNCSSPEERDDLIRQVEGASLRKGQAILLRWIKPG
jgi:hypothetical protein